MLAPRIVPPPVEWLDLFLRSSHRRQYPAKTTIIHHGDVPETLYYILDGSVSVVIEDDDGREIVLAYLSAGDFFGEMGLFDENSQRSAWVVARTKCELAEMNYDQFRRLAADQPDLLYALTTQMASRLRKTSIKVRDLAFLDVTGRVASTLLDLAKMPDAIPRWNANSHLPSGNCSLRWLFERNGWTRAQRTGRPWLNTRPRQDDGHLRYSLNRRVLF